MAAESKGNEQPSSQWTPDFWLRAFKEGVTALIGLSIIVFTLVVAIRSLGSAGKPEMADVKDVLSLIMGLTGVVIGYYFGRIPADARADEAQKQTNSAIAQSAEVSVQAEALADKVGTIIEQSPGGEAPEAPATRSGAPRQAESAPAQTQMRTDLQEVRDQLRSLAAGSRRIR